MSADTVELQINQKAINLMADLIRLLSDAGCHIEDIGFSPNQETGLRCQPPEEPVRLRAETIVSAARCVKCEPNPIRVWGGDREWV